MSKQERLIDYLYGEMDEAARRDFERQLAADTSLRAELEALQQTRRQLQDLPVVEPPLRLVALPARAAAWKRWAAAAAIAAGFLLLLSLLTPRLEIGNGELVLTLGRSTEAADAAPLPPAAATEQQLAQLDSLWQQRMLVHEAALRRQWQEQFRVREAGLRQEWQQQLAGATASQEAATRKQIQAQWQEQLPQLAGLIQDLQLQQQQELQLLLTGFWEHYQQTRTADLESIESEFANLYRSR